MKEVMAVIRMNRINETKKALLDAGLPAFTARRVLGRGKGLVDLRVLHGAKEGRPEAIATLGSGPRLIPKRALSVVVPDEKVKSVVDTIIAANQTGKPGDGKVFVIPVLDAIRVRSGAAGEDAVDYGSEE